MNAPTNNKGFTLVEHLAVFAIIGILAAIAITSYLYVIDRARLTSGISALGALGKEMEMYNIDKGLYPLNINLNHA
jgi:prepilin-type N-terminal cleavage/methylation domain-containing protein